MVMESHRQQPKTIVKQVAYLIGMLIKGVHALPGRQTPNLDFLVTGSVRLKEGYDGWD